MQTAEKFKSLLNKITSPTVKSEHSHISNNQNPREASSRSRIFLFSLVNMCVCWSVYTVPFCHDEKRYRPGIWYTDSPRPYLKTFFFCFLEKVTLRAANLEKLPRHVDFPHISSIVSNYYLFLILQCSLSYSGRNNYCLLNIDHIRVDPFKNSKWDCHHLYRDCR